MIPPRKRMLWIASCCAVALGANVVAAGQNLLPDGTFAQDIAGWVSASPELELGWSTLDVGGDAGSGSLRAVNEQAVDNGTVRSISFCFPAMEGETYALRGAFFYPGDQVRQGTAQVVASAYLQPNCGGDLLSYDFDSDYLVADTWQTLETEVEVPTGAMSVWVLFGFGKLGDGGEAVFHLDDAFFGLAGTTCVATATSLCLVGDRYRVEADWRTASDSGKGRAVEINDGPASGTGYFWFFEDANVEVVVKVLDACVAPFDRVWVFAGGLTDQEVELRVTDTLTGESWSHFNPLGNVWDTVTDTGALAVCE